MPGEPDQPHRPRDGASDTAPRGFDDHYLHPAREARGPAPGPRKPWDRPFPEFAYAESREARRRRCTRAYYHAIYTAHRGWTAPPGSAAFVAYRLKKTIPLPAALGAAVHAAATSCTRAIVAGAGLPAFRELRDTAAATLNSIWRSSRTGLTSFWRRPAAVPMYEEALYGIGPGPEALGRAREKLDRCLANLLDYEEVWRMVGGATAADVVLMEPFYHFTLPDALLADGVRCYAAADLLVRPVRDGLWVIVDYKTGAPDGAIDQMLMYALAARNGLGLDLAAAGCEGPIVALDARPGERLLSFSISAGDIDAAEEQVRANVTAQRTLLVDPAENVPAGIEAFAQTTDRRAWGTCTYRALCYPDFYRIAPFPEPA